MADVRANIVVSMPSQMFTMARSFKACANGKIYIGEIDQDPTIESNQIDIFVEAEDGRLIQIPQPIVINSGGFPSYNGQIVKVVTVEGHAMAIYDSYGAQQFYFPNILKYNPDLLRQELFSPDGVNLPNKFSSFADIGSGIIFADDSGSPSLGVRPENVNGIQINKTSTENNDYGVICVNKKSANEGGDRGFVGSAIRATIDIENEGHSQFEWAIVGIVNNYAKESENVGVYAQANKHSSGGSWGGVWEVCDFNDRPSASADGLTWGGEIDVWTDFDDVAGVRNGLNIVVGSKANVRDGKTPGQQASGSIGLNITSYGGNSDYAIWKNGISIDKVSGSSININGGGTRGIHLSSGSFAVGIDLSGSTFSAAAIRLGSKDYISFDNNDISKLFSSGGALQYTRNNNQLFAIYDDGSGISAPALKLNNNRFVLNGALSTTATSGGSSALPSTVSGFITVTIDGVIKKIPYFNS